MLVAHHVGGHWQRIVGLRTLANVHHHFQTNLSSKGESDGSQYHSFFLINRHITRQQNMLEYLQNCFYASFSINRECRHIFFTSAILSTCGPANIPAVSFCVDVLGNNSSTTEAVVSFFKYLKNCLKIPSFKCRAEKTIRLLPIFSTLIFNTVVQW